MLAQNRIQIPKVSRMSENGNDRTGASIAHICRRKGAWISSLNAARLTAATSESAAPIGRVRGKQTGRDCHHHSCRKPQLTSTELLRLASRWEPTSRLQTATHMSVASVKFHFGWGSERNARHWL